MDAQAALNSATVQTNSSSSKMIIYPSNSSASYPNTRNLNKSTSLFNRTTNNSYIGTTNTVNAANLLLLNSSLHTTHSSPVMSNSLHSSVTPVRRSARLNTNQGSVSGLNSSLNGISNSALAYNSNSHKRY